MQKEIKDVYPKKVCHMLRHVKKKEIVPIQKERKGEMVHTKEFIHDVDAARSSER